MIILHLQLLYVLILYVCQLFAVTINSVQIKDNVVPSKGSAIQLVCSISGFTSETAISLYKTDTQVISFGTRALVNCIANTCIDPLMGYTYSSDNNGIYVNITGLSQNRDGKWWTCRYSSDQYQSLLLKVITIPKSIVYEHLPSVAQDLSVNSVTLKCKTDCAFPAPMFYWYYTENSASRQQYSASANASEKTSSSCTDSEKIYSSTLTLAQYTTFTGKADKTVALQCGIPLFPGLTKGLYTPKSPVITYAVNVTSVTLKDGSTAPTSSAVITVTGGLSKTLACSPSFSRPAATIVWYLGDVEKQRSTSFTFTPSDSDHDQQIYCKAFNLPPERQAVFSQRPILYVQDAPNIEAVLSSDNPKENSSVTVICKAQGRPATYKYTALTQTWSGIVIPNTHSHLAGTAMYSSLDLTSLQLQDTGNYTCHVNNGVRDSLGELDQTGTVYVKVEVSPKILAQQTIFYGDQGDSLNISVPFYSYPAPDKITFAIKGGGPIKNDNKYTIRHLPAQVMTQFHGTDVTLDGHTAVLQIIILEEPDFANYTLMVTNSLGTDEQTIVLSSYRRPEAPYDLQPLHETLTESTIAVEWESGFNGGLQQTFYIEYRKLSDAQWSSEVISEPATTVTLYGLASGTTYVVQIYSQNSIGNSSMTGMKTFVTLASVSPLIQEGSQITSGPIIGISVGGFVLTVLVMVIGVLLWRRHKCAGCVRDNTKATQDVNIANRSTNEHAYINDAAAIDEEENGTMLASTSRNSIFSDEYEDAIVVESKTRHAEASYESRTTNLNEHVYLDLKHSDQDEYENGTVLESTESDTEASYESTTATNLNEHLYSDLKTPNQDDYENGTVLESTKRDTEPSYESTTSTSLMEHVYSDLKHSDQEIEAEIQNSNKVYVNLQI